MRWSGKGLGGHGLRIGLAAFGLLAAAQGSAQPAKPDAGGTTTLQVYSRLTVVDVTASDASGHAMHGLTQSDFTIFEDGKPQPIKNFEEVSLEQREPPRPLPPNVYTNVQPPAPSRAANILLLDFANEAPQDSAEPKQLSWSIAMQKRTKDQAMQALANIPPGTQVAVLSITNHLRVLQSFTSNRALLTAAIDARPYDLDGNASTMEARCSQVDMRSRMVLESLDQIAVDTATIKGRKNLIWFTVGIPVITNPNVRPKCLPDYSKDLSYAYDLLTASQVSVYPISVLGAGQIGEAELSMDAVAEATGGVAYYGSNDVAKGVVSAIDHGANYYSIAYVPPSQRYDGAYHKIEVKVERPGVHLVFRKGYFADDLAKIKIPQGLTLSMVPPEAHAGSMKAPMSRGLAASQDLLFNVGVEPSTAAPKPDDPAVFGTLDPKLKGKHLTRYGLQYVVPAEQIKFKDGPRTTHNGAVEFDVAVYDTDDKLLTGLSQTVTMPLSDSTYQQLMKSHGPVRFFQQIDLPPGQLFVRVGVLDATTDKVGTLELPLVVGKK